MLFPYETMSFVILQIVIYKLQSAAGGAYPWVDKVWMAMVKDAFLLNFFLIKV